jgi:hypothetical protein
MKTVWKWVLGILIVVLVIVAAMFGMRYLVSKGYITMPAGMAWRMDRRFGDQKSFQEFNNPHDGFGPGNGPMMNGRPDFGGYGLMGRGRGFGHFGMAFMFIGGLFRLVVFGALLYGAYWLGKRNARVTLDPTPAAQVVEPVDAPKPRTRKVAKS